MAKLEIKAGTTSKLVDIFIQDSSSTTGAGLTGLTSGSSGLTWYYYREGAASATSVSPTSMTLGTFTSSGFIVVDGTNMPGCYQLGVPDAAIAAGAKSVIMLLKGVTNMAPLVLEIELTAVDNQDAVRYGLTALPNVASGSAGAIPTTGTGANQISVSSGQVILQTGTGTGQLDFTSGVVKANVTQLLGTAWLTPGTAGTPDVNVKLWNALTTVALPLVPTTAGRTLDVSAGGEAGLDWANIGSPTTSVALTGTTIAVTQKVDVDTIKTNPVVNGGTITFPTTATLASTTNITAGTVTTATNVTTVNGLAANVITATSINADAITAAKIADGAIDRATYAADTGHQSIRSGTAQAGSGTTITLDASASASNSFYNNCIVYITGGTGVGQARFITAYVGATKVATVAAWVTNPDNTSTFAILPFDAVVTAPTAAQIATAVWQDTTAGDFTTAGSIGKSLFTSGAVPGAAGGLFIAGTNAATAITTSLTTTFTGNLTGSVASVSGNVGGNVTGSVGSVATGGIAAASFAAGAIDAAAIANAAIDRATFAADTGLQTIRSNTAQAGAAGTVTLDASASATTDFYAGTWIYLTGGTGVGQVRLCTAYNGTSKVATISPNWATNPDNTSTFAVLPAGYLAGITGNVSGSVGSVTGLTASDVGAIKTKTDFLPSATAGAAGGLFIAGTNAATTITTALTTTFTGNLTGSVGSVATGGIAAASFAAGAIDAAAIANGAIDRATFAADTGLVTIRSNTAQAGSGTTITLDASASAVDSFYNNDLILITGGTGVGQARFVTAYVGATKVATVATWVTAPDNTSTFAILPFDAVAGATAPTAAQVATAVWQDTTAGDFTTAGSIGKSLFTSGVVPGAAGGLFIAGSNAATTVNITGNITGNLSGSVGSVTAGVTLAAAAVQAIWDALTSALTTSGSIGKLLVDNINATITSRMATYTQPTGFLAATFPSGTVANTTNITAGTVTTATNVTTVNGLAANVITATSIAADAITAAKIADAAIDRATFAADTGMVNIRAGTAQAGSGTTITLDAGASASNSFYNNDIVYITGGTGAGQARFITAYVGATKVATVATWVTNPDNTSTFAILPFDAVAGSTAPTVAQIATAVWQDATSGDFTTSGSIGKSLFTSGAVPGAAGGVFIAGSNAATTVNITGNITGNLSGSVGSVTAGVTLAASAVQAIWDALTSALTTVGSIGKLLVDNVNATITSRMATYTQPTGFLAATFPTGTVANTTNITAGTITTVTNLTNAPTNGDFTAAMKTSLNAATPASVTGDVGGNVVGSVGSVVGLTASNLDATVSSRATPAQVKTQVVAALASDTYAEPSGAPPATNTLAGKIGYNYEALRNKITVTASAKTFYDDSGAAQWAKSLSDDGTTYTEAEGA